MLGVSSPKIRMPFGPPPCVEDSHRHAHIPAPPPVPGIPDLQAKVSAANKYIEDEFQALTATRYKMKELVRRNAEDYAKYSAPLGESCKKVRDNLVELAEETGECENAQEVELPKLFTKRAETPALLKQFAKIKGCAKFQETSNVVEADDCKCATGSEKDGCKFPTAHADGTEMDADHSLLCSHLRKRVLPGLQLWRMTAPGGACFVNAETPFNKPMLPTGMPKDFEMPSAGGPTEESSMPPLLLALEPPIKRPETSQDNRRLAAERARAFL